MGGLLTITLVALFLYGMMMFWFYIGIKKVSEKYGFNGSTPFVTIIVSLKNEENNVPSLLNGLRNQDYPSEFLELILVDDHSTDNTYTVLQTFESDTIKVIRNTGIGKKQAIETAVIQAKGEWILVTDADCNIPLTWASSMIQSIEPSTKMVLGPVFIESVNSFLTQIQSIEFVGLQGATCGSAGVGKPISANAANMLFRKDVFEKLKPYRNNYNLKTGDDQFLLMAVCSSFPNSVVYSMRKESIIQTHPVHTWSTYFTQRIRWASKGSAYTQSFPKIVGLLVFAVSVLLVLDFLFGMFVGNFKLALIPVLIKLMFDLFIVLPMKRFSNANVNPASFLLSGLVYAFVVVASVVAGIFKK